MPGPCIGIDLGTTYSCVAVFKQGKVEIIPNDAGNRTTPSMVSFTETDRLIGEAAKNQMGSNAGNTIFDAKRLIGRKYDDPVVQKDAKHWPFEVVNEEGKPKINCQHKNESKYFDPEEISSMVLVKMKETAESFLGDEVVNAVITVPAYFNDSQRQATKDAGAIAGLKVLRVINEPTAAGIAYGFDKRDGVKQTVLVFDLGGGTFDVSILSIDGGNIEVKATAGDTHLGGEDIDDLLVKHFLAEIKRKLKKDVSENKKHMSKLRKQCEEAKRMLSSSTEANVELESIDFSSTITRARFDELCHDLFQGTVTTVESALKDAKMSKGDVDEVILVGGSTRIPKIQTMIQQFFGEKQLNKTVHPDEAVACGAAILGANLSNYKDHAIQRLNLTDVAPLSLGTDVKGDIMSVIVPRNCPLPTEKMRRYVTTSDNQEVMAVHVYEGERHMIKDNNELGKFGLKGLPPKPAGEIKVEVTFKVDKEGILNVSAVETSQGSREELTIVNEKGRLSEEDIERMVEQAERFAIDDQKQRERVQAVNALDDYIARSKRRAREKDDARYQQKVEAKADEIRQWMDDNKAAGMDEIRQMRRKFEDVVNIN